MELLTSKLRVLTSSPLLKPTVLVYQADGDYSYLLKYLAGKEVTIVEAKGPNVKAQVAALNYDIAILDFLDNNPGDFKLLTILRHLSSETPAIMLTGSDDTNHEYEALKLGAFYCSRPYNPGCIYQLIINLAKTLRGAAVVSVGTDDSETVFNGVRLDMESANLVYNGDITHLSGPEAQIIKYLFKYQEQLVPTKKIKEYIWGSASPEVTKSFNVANYHLRKKAAYLPITLETRHAVVEPGGGSVPCLIIKRK